jgi:hypothetical protein
MAGVGPLLLVAAVVGIVLWVRHSGTEARTGEGTQGRGPEEGRSRVSLLTEAVGYVGTILVLTGGGVALGQRWTDFSKPTRLGILGAATLVFLAIGTLTRTSTEPAFKRLTSVTWAVSVGTFAGTAGVVNELQNTEPETAFLVIATSSTAYAMVLWGLNPRALQHAVMFAGLLFSAGSILVRVIHEPPTWVVPTAIWAIAVLWVSLGWTRRISPWWTAVPLGLLVALIAPAAIQNAPARFMLGIGTAASVMALGVAAKFTPGLAMGAVGLLGYVIGVVTYYFSDTAGVPLVLAITGLLVLVFAAVTARLSTFTRKGAGGEISAATPGQPVDGGQDGQARPQS